jgi:dihydrofolate synthase/folylpolyglutamate synthase
MPSSSLAAMAAADRAAAALDRLARLHPKLIDLGLDRSFALLEKLGNPHHHLPPTIHVAGTNGKGSTIAFLRAMAEEAGLTVHVYSSPHLCRFNERIRLAGRLIDDGGLADLLEEVETANGDTAVTFFEVTTAAAMLAFSRIPADLLLLETGLGGALDSTNVLKTPLATIITPIAQDHEHFLGTDLGQIASQKAGIMRVQTPCYCAYQQAGAMHALTAHAENIGASLQVAGRDFYLAETDDGGIHLSCAGEDFFLPAPGLRGRHQLDNAALAAACLFDLAAKNRLPSRGQAQATNTFAGGIKSAVWPGRVQPLNDGLLAELWPHRPIWLDGAHNAHGARALAKTLSQIDDGKWNIICSALNTRDPAEFLAPLATLAGPVRCLNIPDQPASLSAIEMTDAALAQGLDAAATTSIIKAFDKLDPAYPVIICGSLYLAGHVLVQNKTLPD